MPPSSRRAVRTDGKKIGCDGKRFESGATLDKARCIIFIHNESSATRLAWIVRTSDSAPSTQPSPYNNACVTKRIRALSGVSSTQA
jgi:hypothetical protein